MNEGLPIITSVITGIFALGSNYFIYLKRSRTDNEEVHQRYDNKFGELKDAINNIATNQKLIKKDVEYMKGEINAIKGK